VWCSGRLTCSSKGAGSGYAVENGTEITSYRDNEKYDSFAKAKKECCRYCTEIYAPICAAYQVTRIEGGCPYDFCSDNQPYVACVLYEKGAKISKCGNACPQYTSNYGSSSIDDDYEVHFPQSSTRPKDNYVGVAEGTPSKCSYFGAGLPFPPMEADYEYLNYKWVNGFAYKGFKSKTTLLKTVKKIPSVKKCFQKCRDTDRCYSFTYDTEKKTCRMNSGTLISQAFYWLAMENAPEYAIKLCKTSNRYVTGYWVDMDD